MGGQRPIGRPRSGDGTPSADPAAILSLLRNRGEPPAGSGDDHSDCHSGGIGPGCGSASQRGGSGQLRHAGSGGGFISYGRFRPGGRTVFRQRLGPLPVSRRHLCLAGNVLLSNDVLPPGYSGTARNRHRFDPDLAGSYWRPAHDTGTKHECVPDAEF